MQKDYTMTKTIFLQIIVLLITISSFGQKTLIRGRIVCSDNFFACCKSCLLIENISNPDENTSPEENGLFEMIIDKKEGNFSLRIQSISYVTLEIKEIPYNDTLDFKDLEMFSCKALSKSQFKHRKRELSRQIKSEEDYNKFIEDNFGEIQPFDSKMIYLDFSNIPADSMICPINNKRKIEIDKSNKKEIILLYNDLTNKND